MAKLVLLSSITEPCPDLVLPDGRNVPIREVDGISMQLLYSMHDAGPDSKVTYWDIAVRCLPTLPEQEVRAMTLSQAANIVSIACGSAMKVLDALGETPAPTTTGTPAPSTPTPSDS